MKIVMGADLNGECIENVIQIVRVPNTACTVIYAEAHPLGRTLGDDVWWNLVFDGYEQIKGREVAACSTPTG